MEKTYHKKHEYPGLLIVVEGTDAAGKSTQIERLREWLAIESYGVMVSEWKTSKLMPGVIDQAKERNLLNANTFSLLYACDFTDRLERNIIPALKAGLIVLMDRYIYTGFARDVVRGVQPDWVRNVYNFAPQPDMVFYLEMPVKALLKRIIASTGLDYYESGRDIGLSTDFYESFKLYQTKILEEYSHMTEEFGFVGLDGNLPVPVIHNQIKEKIKELINSGAIY